MERVDVLFVDDEESVLKSIQRLCRKEPWVIKTANGAEQALAIFEEAKISLIVSDMRMPGMDGAELLSRIAKQYPEVKQILLTGYSDVDSTVKAINSAKISRYVAKPWENDQLKEVIAEVLAEYQLREEYVALVSLTEQQNEELLELNDVLEEKVAIRTRALKQTVVKLDAANASLKSSYASFVRVFSQFIELRDTRLSPSGNLVSAHVRSVAERMGLDEELSDQLSFAAMLRNLGKLTFPDEVIGLPFEAMDSDKKTVYRRYPELGQMLLLSIENLQEAANIIGQHQERFNGRGYPNNLSGDKISIAAQILGIVCDYHDLINGVLTSARRSPRQVCEYLGSQKDKRYSGVLVEHYLDVLAAVAQSDTEHESTFIEARALAADMVLAQDIVTPEGLFLISKNTVLSTSVIEKIRQFQEGGKQLFDIFVYDYSISGD